MKTFNDLRGSHVVHCLRLEMHMGGAKECPPIERSCAISKPDAKGKVSLSSLPVPPSPFTLRFRLSLSLCHSFNVENVGTTTYRNSYFKFHPLSTLSYPFQILDMAWPCMARAKGQRQAEPMLDELSTRSRRGLRPPWKLSDLIRSFHFHIVTLFTRLDYNL